MRKILKGMSAATLLVVALWTNGCVTEQTNSVNTNASATNANATANTSPSPAASPSTGGGASAGASNLPVTLPVLDAMFAEESFGGELKSKLQLTDEQLNNLRSIAREETSSLRETDEGSGTTSAAKSRATEKIEGVIGKEKAQQLSALVSERWSRGEGEGAGTAAGGGASQGMPSKPNAVPTDTRIVVNAPAYRMDVFDNGKLVKSYKVGIGYPEFPLPTGLRKASTIILNPTWTPPDEPWVEGSNKVKAGQKIEAGSKLNPLGVLKIPIGSPSLIHGGKSAAKLGTFASHGCVGLTDPLAQDFAQLLAQIGGAELSKEAVAAAAKKRDETKNVKLERPVPVELRYETIVVEDGRLHLYRDVYDHDTNTEENLRAVLEANGVSLDQLSEAERTQVMDALKEMARDASGKPTDATTPQASPTPDAKGAKGTEGAKGAKETKDKDDAKVTRTIKGRKEIVIEIAALQGKGYPAPLGGGFVIPKAQSQKSAATTAPASKKGGRR